MEKKLDSNIIKLIAIIAMTIDHIAWMIYPGYINEIIPIILHLIGRITTLTYNWIHSIFSLIILTPCNQGSYFCVEYIFNISYQTDYLGPCSSS